MVEVTGDAQLAAWQQCILPPVEEVRPGLWSIPVPFPDNPLRYTLGYLVVDGSSAAVIDPGWDSEPGWLALADGLATAGVDPAEVTEVLLTHTHFDHHGMTGRLVRASGAEVSMHRLERDSLPSRLRVARSHQDDDAAWLARCGIPAAVIAELRPDEKVLEVARAMVAPTRLLEHGSAVEVGSRSLVPVWTPGHTAGHLCFAERDTAVLLTGDHMLPRISPAIGLTAIRTGEPLADYLASLENLEAYDWAEALPGHEYRFRGIAARARELREHHHRRCEEILDALDVLGAATVWDLAARLSWSRGWAGVTGFMRRAAVSETSAHLRYLWSDGSVTSTGVPTRPGEPEFWVRTEDRDRREVRTRAGCP